MTSFRLRSILVVSLSLAAAACGGKDQAQSNAAAQTTAVEVRPEEVTVRSGGTAAFAAAVTGSANTAVTWAVVEAGGGTVDTTGLYTAPASSGTFHVRATSQADATAQAVATVTVVPPVAVAVVPKAPSVFAGGNVTFSATVTGTTNQGVTWAVQEATGCGTITAAGVYTAPAAAGTCHVVATSVADATKSDVATVTVTAPVAVAVSPKTPTVAAGGTLTFTATVTGTTNQGVTWAVQEATGCGTITAAGVYTAPPAAATCHVVATSVADGTKSDVATVAVSAPPPPVAVAISPSPASVDSCGTLTFTATVTNASNGAVTWSVLEGAAGGTITSAGAYTAPNVAGTYHVVGTSVADPTKSATSVVTVSDRILSVAVSPQIVTVTAGGTTQFTATVTTTCGSFAALRTATASAAGVVTVQ
jgi:hypothetical protein